MLSAEILVGAAILCMIASVTVTILAVRSHLKMPPKKRYYVQEHEVFGDSSRVIWTSEPLYHIDAVQMKRELTSKGNGDTWFTIVRVYED